LIAFAWPVPLGHRHRFAMDGENGFRIPDIGKPQRVAGGEAEDGGAATGFPATHVATFTPLQDGRMDIVSIVSIFQLVQNVKMQIVF
jgi:hypothetical protein